MNLGEYFIKIHDESVGDYKMENRNAGNASIIHTIDICVTQP